MDDLKLIRDRARLSCSGCKLGVPHKRFPGEGLVHCDLFATRKGGAYWRCEAAEILSSVIQRYDDRDNPVFMDGFETLFYEGTEWAD